MSKPAFSSLRILLITLVISLLAVSSHADAARVNTSPDRGKNLITSGAKMVVEGKNLVMNELAQKQIPADGGQIEGEKLIADGYAMIGKSQEFWTPSGDSVDEAKRMMDQGARMVISGAQAMQEDLARRGIAPKGLVQRGLSMMAKGRQMILKGQKILL